MVANPNAQKTPFTRSLNQFVDGKLDSFQKMLGKAVPASLVSVDPTGTIATVNIEVQSDTIKFPQVKCPVYGPRYVRWPLQKGDKGVVFSSDLYLGGMSGLGDGTATLNPQPNLSSLVWFPIGNINFAKTQDPQSVLITGPDGVILQSDDQSVQLILNKETGITLIFGGVKMTFDKNGIGTITAKQINLSATQQAEMIVGNNGVVVTGTTQIDNKQFLPHTHTNVTPGGGNSGPVT